MADEYLHGVRVLEINGGTRPVRSIATAVIGVVCTANDANAEHFPLNKPVLLTDPKAAIAHAGTQGTLMRTLKAISDMVRTPTIVVRVEEPSGENAANTLTANIIGTITNKGDYTGLKALEVAKSICGVKPRILAVPKFDNQAVATELAAIAKKLNAFAYASTYNCATKEAAIAYQRNFSQRELMLIHGDFLSFNTATSDIDTDYATARAVGLRAYIDEKIGWQKNISNVAINGVSGVTKPVSFDIQDASTDANLLNSKNISVALNHSGFRIWGSRTCSDDPLFAFEQYTRTAQIVRDTFAEAYDWAIDKDLTPTLVKDMVEMINAKFRFWKKEGYLVDGTAWVDVEINTKDEIKDGKFYIDYDYTSMPSLENLNLRQRITDRYLVDFAAKVATA